MGYYSEIVIAVRKEILSEDLVYPVIPKELRNMVHQVIGDAVYWHIPSWKWYDSYPEIAEILEFFKLLDERDTSNVGYTSSPWFGATRVGEGDNDVETWGEPYHFNINTVHYINFPGRE
mgnify:FL=1